MNLTKLNERIQTETAHTEWFHLIKFKTRQSSVTELEPGRASWEGSPPVLEQPVSSPGAAAAVHTPVQTRELQA